ncbi:MAG: hypothetical protein NTV34_18775 [Proteobacteria bacterium]|nr:hypothetical protein [Pseudomonadota bacterium]
MALKFILFLTVLLASTKLVAVETVADKSTSSGEVKREIFIRAVEQKGDHLIRVYVSATEGSSGIKYPISTIERNMMKVEFTNTATPPTEVKSLSILGSQQGDLKRALFVAFDLSRQLTGRELVEVRDRISEIVSELPSQFLTVTAISQGSARIIADVTPEKSDNINRIQQQLAALPSEGDGPALSDALCVAAERFHAWNLQGFKASDQKILILLSPPGDGPSTERFRAENCWRSLIDQKVRVYQISFGKTGHPAKFDLATLAAESGGFVHGVNGPLDILAASKNIIALLKNEYVLDVDAPDISLEDQPLELKVKVSYHDELVISEIYNVGFVMPTLAQVFKSGSGKQSSLPSESDVYEHIEKARKINFLIMLAMLVVTGLLISLAVSRLRAHLRSTSCNTCREVVRKDHRDCPFRKPNCIARLVMMSGPHAGQTYPLLRGSNRISAFAAGGVKLPRGRVRWLHHGTIVADGFKVAYTPTKIGLDRLNGWPITETKLMGQGHVLKLGKHQLRLEVKPGASGTG